MRNWEAVGALHRLELLRRIKVRELMADSPLHPGQPRLLQYIWDHPGCTQKEAAASLKRLEKAGFVSRKPDGKDARRNQLFITEQGIGQMEANRRKFEQLDQQLFAGMTEAEVDAFGKTCEKMFDNLADESCRHLTVWKLARQAQEKEERKP